MHKTRVILIGGFLGAGKTTLVAKATEQLIRQGKRVGLITNDQAANLVDTAILKEAVDAVQEVAGGCFCCRFDDLMTAMNRLVEAGSVSTSTTARQLPRFTWEIGNSAVLLTNRRERRWSWKPSCSCSAKRCLCS